MSLGAELLAEANRVFRDERWETRVGTVVPTAQGLKLANDGVELDATVLYADLAESTSLVDGYKAMFAAEVYKVYLYCAAKVIRSEGGEITAYDGDRIMAVYLGDAKNSQAARTALKINYAVRDIINPAMKAFYKDTSYRVVQCVGVDTSKLLVVRTGIRGANDLVWVGRAANHAAKLCSLRDGEYASWITADVYGKLNAESKYGGDPSRDMWEARSWTAMGNRSIYRSSWSWKVE